MKELRADDRLLSRRGEGMTKHKRRILHILAITALAVSGFIAAGALAVTGYATDSTTTVTTTPEGEGCTPGFWKQEQHFDSWTAPYDPGDPLSSVFDAAALTAAGVDPDTTLLEALQTGGGGVDALLRHAVAAVLNAASPDVDYPFTVDAVVDMVNDALVSGDFEGTKDVLEGANEASCPLD
jgi:hypothetical protein